MLPNSYELPEAGKPPYRLPGVSIATLTETFLSHHTLESLPTNQRDYTPVQPQEITVNSGTFTSASRLTYFPQVSVQQTEQDLILSCACQLPTTSLCPHQTHVLLNLMQRPELRIFFDRQMRYERFYRTAQEYGLEKETNLDEYFDLEYQDYSVRVKPKLKELVSIEEATQQYEKLGAEWTPPLPRPDAQKRFIVFRRHRFYEHFFIEYYEAATTKEGKIKNPLRTINPMDFVWQTDDTDLLKFYTALTRFQNPHRTKNALADLGALKALVQNPLELDVYYHPSQSSEKIIAQGLTPVRIQRSALQLHLMVHQRESFYQVLGQLLVNDQPYELPTVTIAYDYFFLLDQTLHLIDSPDLLRVLNFLKLNQYRLLLHESKFEEFRQQVLVRLENHIRVTYTYLKPATPEQIQESGFDQPRQWMLYLSEKDSFISLTPVLKYGPVEVPVLSRRQIYSLDPLGAPFTLERDDAEELDFISLLLQQHPDFYEQLPKAGELPRDYFFLHKSRFLEEDWFLSAFEAWQSRGITILGFNELGNNRLNGNKAKISVHVSSGLNWFETSIQVAFGAQKVSLKHLHKSVKNKSRYVTLGDGTVGILPTEWLEKFDRYFQAADLIEDRLRTPAIQLPSIRELYEEELLSESVRQQWARYAAKVANFDAIEAVPVPEGLQTHLRNYQKQGLYWLNFLDEFGFGGCLADDMGLGKTIQIIAFILSQRLKVERNTNLIVVPTSLLFNWQAEVAKFAPSIRVLTLHGSGRVNDPKTFDAYEIILTSYGTLISDIHQLKSYAFNYVFLDESQAIKNPESQRYQAVCLLQSRNRVVLTGTPLENNTFDLYGQLSFACPGLLGSKQSFKTYYSTPIDRFQDRQRAQELQKKVSPFILRRTKAQVASELPDKTEMVLFCEMGTEQRRVYHAYEQEFRNFLTTRKEGDIPRESLHILQGLTKLRQLCNSPALLNDETFYSGASAKIDVLLEEIETRAPQHKILVFSQFVGMLDLIKSELEFRGIAFEYLTGQTKNRAARVQRFQTDDSVRVFLISLKAGGTGLNLTEADYVYLVDPWWNPAVENQAIDRSYRLGQTKKVVAVRLICPHTIEEKMQQLQQSKQELASDLIRTDQSLLKSLTRQDLLSLLSSN
ncbi:DEAD/DEAH box helicase [Siphonobacter sp.]|uniref:DEAD/DEAH box helicase n=1 Tax=Siphonobacter sp. TaxID=1869184 RepID=UPI003B3B712B